MIYGKTGMHGESHYNFGIFFKKKQRIKDALFHFKAAQALFPPESEISVKIRKEVDSINEKPAARKDEHKKN